MDKAAERGRRLCPRRRLVGFHDNPSLYGLIRWTVVHDPDSHWTGTMQLQFIVSDGRFGGLFPTVTWLSPTIGSWVRTGLRTFDYTVISYGVDETGVPFYIWKANGTIELSPQCDALEVESIDFEFYSADQDPFGSDPPAYGCIPMGPSGSPDRSRSTRPSASRRQRSAS